MCFLRLGSTLWATDNCDYIEIHSDILNVSVGCKTGAYMWLENKTAKNTLLRSCVYCVYYMYTYNIISVCVTNNCVYVLQKTYPEWGIEIKCGKKTSKTAGYGTTTNLSYGPWADRQRLVIVCV